MKQDRNDWSDTFPTGFESSLDPAADDPHRPKPHTRVVRSVLLLLAALVLFRLSKISA